MPHVFEIDASGERRLSSEDSGQRARGLLDELVERDGLVAAEDVAIVVAHPDDESVGLGAQLRRLVGATVVHVTDGAPRNMTDAARHGFASWEDYAAARRRELEAAMEIAGVPKRQLVCLNLPDQEAAFQLSSIARELARLFSERGITVAISHAYEGGHPDHDAVAFAVHGARHLRVRAGCSLAVIEMPLYRAEGGGWAHQRFAPESEDERVIWMSEEERARKRRILDAFATQRQTLAAFDVDAERLRMAPRYDFQALPNGGVLLYERYPWGMSGERWQALVGASMDELQLAP